MASHNKEVTARKDLTVYELYHHVKKLETPSAVMFINPSAEL